MGVFLVYNLKLSFCFILFYFLYKWFLSRNTFFRINRWVLLGMYAFTLIMPFIDIRTESPTVMYEMTSFYEQLLIEPQPSQLSWTYMVVLIYMTGMSFFIIRYFYFTSKVLYIILTGEKERTVSGRKLVISDRKIISFSWMNVVVISRRDYEDNGTEIVLHEEAHIKNRHYFDLFIAEVFSVIQWFNPVVWFMKNELKDIHEFEADYSVLNSGVDARKYQLLLIKKAVGSKCFNSMTNSLNHSKLKKRITMMLKEKSSPWAHLKYLAILPVAAFSVALFARPGISSHLDGISTVKVNELPSIGEVFGKDNSFQDILTDTINLNVRMDNSGKEGIVRNFEIQMEDEIAKDGKEMVTHVNIMINGEGEEVVTTTKQEAGKSQNIKVNMEKVSEGEGTENWKVNLKKTP